MLRREAGDGSKTAVHAPAKVNLALHVTGRRDDGYHLIDTLVVFTASGDRITVTSSEADSLSITGSFAGQLQGEPDNLVARARDLTRGLSPRRKCGPVAISLEKNLPVAAGIGGGSADAAATLRALNAHWGLGHDARTLAKAAQALGADLPMCVHARPLRARGAGEDIDLLDDIPPLALILANPGVAVSTPVVFKALTERDNASLPPIPATRTAEELAAWLGGLRNDLQAPAVSVAPGIREVLEELSRQRPLVARMSGSGATCFALFQDMGRAQRAAAALQTAHPGWFVIATPTLPSPGADDARH